MPDSPPYAQNKFDARARSDHRRQTRDDAFYSSATWRRLRAYVLSKEPVCRACKRRWAREVDHIRPRRRAPELAYEVGNLQPLCSSCHSRKTRRGD